jgi:GDP-D-glucose phosphorylase
MIYCEDDFIYEIRRNSTEKTDSKFDIRLQSEWNSGMEKGYFRYRLNVKHTRILPGKYSFLAQVKNGKRMFFFNFDTDIYLI